MKRHNKLLAFLLLFVLIFTPQQGSYADDDKHDEKEHEKYEEHEEEEEEEHESEEGYEKNEKQTVNTQKEVWHTWSKSSTLSLAYEQSPITTQQQIRMQKENEQECLLEVLPYQGQILVPVQEVAAYLGAEVYEYSRISVVEVIQRKKHLIFKEGSRAVYEDMYKTPMPTVAITYNGKIHVPVSVIANALGWDITWNEDQTILLKTRVNQNG